MAAFIFDIDGTIIDSMPFHARSWDLFLAQHGVELAPDVLFKNTAGRTGVEVMRAIFGALTDLDAHAFVREKEAIYRELFASEFREIAGFAQFARAAKAEGLKLACATAGDPDNIAFALTNLGMTGFFDAAVGAHDVARGKPEPDLFLLAAARTGTDPAARLVFEDAPLGIEGARRAGMRAVGITSTMAAHELRVGTHVVATAPDFTTLDVRALAAHLAATITT